MTRQTPDARESTSAETKPNRFLVVGLPRSGSTYLMTLLNAHKLIHCSGEQFNPYGIVGISDKNDDPKALFERDKSPLIFMDRFFKRAAETHPEAHQVGFKYMVGHNVRVLKNLRKHKDMRIIHIWRRNKLAQVSSLIKATESKRWAQAYPDKEYVNRKIDVGPRKISETWHELATYDALMPHFLRSLPNKCVELEYCEMFEPGFNERICEFLGVDFDPDMKSPLVKQGSNNILDRFAHPKPIENYFKRLGHENWLEEEL